ncbi:MAG: hemerythrin domain-containing protein [Bacteroidia bacterium]
MNLVKPLKRDFILQSLSRDHHHALLLCWKLKTGFLKGVSVERMKVYANWFYKNYLVKHFELEEKYVFPILGMENKLIKLAIEEHKLLSKLFTDNSNIEDSLKQIQAELEKHIRFEERTLFKEIQNIATQAQLEKIKQVDSEEKFIDNLADKFWDN